VSPSFFNIPLIPLEVALGYTYLLDFDDSGRVPAPAPVAGIIIPSLLSIMIQYTAKALPEHAKHIPFNGVCPVGEILQVDKVTYKNL
jgi:hypothetical protein